MDVEELLKNLDERKVRRLPANWKEGRACPECGASAERQKCMWDVGPSCQRHDPDAYDPSPYVVEPDPVCTAAAATIRRLIADKP